MDESVTTEASLWGKMWGWTPVGVAASIIISFGVGIMTSPHPYVADTFFVAGTAILLAKFWTWEDSKQQSSRKTALLLAGGTVVMLLLLAAACGLSFYLSKSSIQKQPELSSNSLIKNDKPSSSESTQIKPPVGKQGPPTPKLPRQHAPFAAPPSQANPTYEQKCQGSACAQGPGAQATYNQFGTPKLVMDEKQRIAIRQAMSRYRGMPNCLIYNEDATQDSIEYANNLAAELTACTPEFNSEVHDANMPRTRPGVTILFGRNRRPEAEALQKVLLDNGIPTTKVPFLIPDADIDSYVEIRVRPNT